MRPTTLLPLTLALFLSATTASSSCTNTYNGYTCSGSVYGNSTAGINSFICCKGSSSCNANDDGTITTCDSGTQVPLTQPGASAAAATVPTAGGVWLAVSAVVALSAGFTVVL